jgi:predicted lipid-binding transport protein (Tim44 family)
MKLKNILMALAVTMAGVGMVAAPMDAEARRLGGGRASGMQRQMPAKQPSAAPDASPNQVNKSAAPTNTAGAAAQPAKRSWMGPIAGLAAGLGIAALMSHLGMGEAFGNFLMMALLAVAAVALIGFLMRRFKGGAQQARGPQLVGAGAPLGQQFNQPASRDAFAQPMQRQAFDATPAAVGAGAAGAAPGGNLANVPAGFDAAGFQRIAKMIFIRLQAANDAGNVDDLRKFTTPELFASLRLDLQERGSSANQTDVMQLDAELVDTAQENGQWVASVRFHGLIREDINAGAEPFDELWHLVKPLDNSGEWAIAGITPLNG